MKNEVGDHCPKSKTGFRMDFVESTVCISDTWKLQGMCLTTECVFPSDFSDMSIKLEK